MARDNNLQILIIDDDDGFRDVLSGFLESRHFRVSQASSGKEGLALLNTETPDIVFLDVYMPGMTGLEVLPAIKKRAPQVKVIMMSGYGTEEIAREAIDLGADDFLNKPIELDHLDDVFPLICPTCTW